MDGLIQEGQFVGWVYQMDYEQALILTHDAWKLRAKGVPLHCFLVATAGAKKADATREILLLRVTGPMALPHDDEAVRAKIESCQGRAADQASDDAKD